MTGDLPRGANAYVRQRLQRGIRLQHTVDRLCERAHAATRGLVTGWLSAVVGRSRSIQQAADAGLEVIRSITTDADAAMIRTSV